MCECQGNPSTRVTLHPCKQVLRHDEYCHISTEIWTVDSQSDLRVVIVMIKRESVVIASACLGSRQNRAKLRYPHLKSRNLRKGLGLQGVGEGRQGDLENCVYLWKNPGYAP